MITSRLTLRAPARHHASFAPERVLDAIERAIDQAELATTGALEERWHPHGLSAGAWGPDFRLLLHTWPEHGLATIDLWVLERKSGRVIRSLELALGWTALPEPEEVSAGSPDRGRTAPFGES